MMISDMTMLFICIGLGLGLAGWIIHLYTLILSAFSTPERWTIRIAFNHYHEAIIEVILFTVICGFFIYIFLSLIIGGL